MRGLALTLLGVVVATVVFFAGIWAYDEFVLSPRGESGAMAVLADNHDLVTVNTTRVGSDDPIETAVAVSQIIYPATEPENTPGAIVLVNQDSLPEVLVAMSRVQHFPVNAPLLYVDEDGIPEMTRSEMLRLEPEGVAMDNNVQVYLVGTIGDVVRREVEAMGYETRALAAADPVLLAEVADNWTSTLHGDHRNNVVIANLDNPMPAVPSAFWNAHRGDGFAWVTNAGVPDATRRILQRRAHGPWIYLFGDESVISAETARVLAQYGHVTRVRGADAAETSAFMASFLDEGMNWGAWVVKGARVFGWGITEAGHNGIFVNLDGPAGWQNAVVASTLSHMGKHAPALVVNVDDVPEAVRAHLLNTKPYPTAPRQQLLNHGWIIGGPETISWETQVEIDTLLDPYLEASEAPLGGS